MESLMHCPKEKFLFTDKSCLENCALLGYYAASSGCALLGYYTA